MSVQSRRRTTVEQINNELNAIDQRIKKIKKQIEMPKTDEDIKFQMEEFLNVRLGRPLAYRGVFITDSLISRHQ